jgi:Niemann-Pick C1 protein
MPGLQSFCIYAAIGIIAVFILQATFFVAWFAVDQKRLEDRRNGFCFWIKYTDAEFVPSAWSQKSYFQDVFDGFFSKVIFTTPGKVSQGEKSILYLCSEKIIYSGDKIKLSAD